MRCDRQEHAKTGESIEKCRKCKIVVKAEDNALCCDLCDEWLHAGCGQVNKDLYHILKKYKDQEWYCMVHCKGQVRQFTIKIKKLTQEMDEMKQELETLKTVKIDFI